jgi:hypothetical protein
MIRGVGTAGSNPLAPTIPSVPWRFPRQACSPKTPAQTKDVDTPLAGGLQVHLDRLDTIGGALNMR